MIRYFPKTKWEEIVFLASKTDELWRSSINYWWVIGTPPFYSEKGEPCGPAGECLYRFENSKAFVENAAKRAFFYGQHGVIALEAAYHGNITIDDQPIGFDNWEFYNKLIDRFYSDMNNAKILIGARSDHGLHHD